MQEQSGQDGRDGHARYERYERYERDRRHLVGGISAPSRLNPALGQAVLIERGDGARLYRTEGGALLDLHMSFGATILGHNHPAVRRAIEHALEIGIVSGAETVHQARLAARVCELVPCAEQVRFAGSGSEATNAALRLARAYTGRDKVLKFEGHFHGLHEHVVYSAHPPLRAESAGQLLEPVVESGGVPAAFAQQVLVAPWNDLAAVERAFKRHGGEIAAVLLEPVNYNSGALPADPAFLRALREITRDRGAVLIFDEVLSGFRTGTACAQGYYQVTPDVCLLAKAVANGVPLAIIAGSAEVMSAFGPTGPAALSGTYSGHLFGVLAAQATLDELAAPGRYDGPQGLLAVGERLYRGLDTIFRRHGVRCRVQGIGARFGLLFGLDPDTPATTYQQAARHDGALQHRFVRAAFEQGVYFHSYDVALGHHGFSAAHTPADVDEALDRIETACRALDAAPAPGGPAPGQVKATATASGRAGGRVRVFLAQCSQETGSFLPQRATVAWFEQHILTEGDGLLRVAEGRRLELAGALAAARALGAEVAPGLAAWAMPWGILERQTYATLRGRLLSSLEGARRTGPVHAAVLVLHGAMQAEGTDDPEGDLLTAVRATLGPDVPLVATLDLHANVTAAMLAAADALVAYQTVPHVDMYETGYAALDLAVRAARGEVRPVTAGRKLPLVTPAETHDTRTAPMAPLAAAGRALAQGPVLRASLCAAQPWLDVPELGWTALVVGDADRAAAQRAADALAAQAWRARAAFQVHKLPVAEAARRAAVAPPGRPVVVSDSGDNTSGGAPGDSVHLLRGLLAAAAGGGLRVAALLWLADAGTAHACAAAGAGAEAAVSLGHVHDRRFGPPLGARVRVVRVVQEARFVIGGPSWTGTPMTPGLTAVVDLLDRGADGGPRVRLVVCERPVMDIDPGLYRCVGEAPEAYQLVQVRSPAAFRATYESMASEIVSVVSPGPTTSDLPSLPWTKAPRPLFPLDPHTTFPEGEG